MEDILRKTKHFINKQIDCRSAQKYGFMFSSCSKVYPFTNENIKEYIDIVDTENANNALTVMASGDHAINLISKGIMNIDTFDVNQLTEYYALGLKRAMFEKFSYSQFQEFILNFENEHMPLNDLSASLEDLLPFMEGKYREFWQIIIDYNYKKQKSLRHPVNLLSMLLYEIDPQATNNPYFNDVDEYNKVKENIGKANITFKRANANNLHNEFNKEYDLVLLSNILDYFGTVWGNKWSEQELLKYIENLKKITKDNGNIFLKYTFRQSITEFRDSKAIDLSHLGGESFPVSRSTGDGNKSEVYDSIYLIRKK